MKTTLDELQAFAIVVDTGSITAAAEQLKQTVGGVSRALNRLEKKLDTTLLRRTTRRLELTEEGSAFLRRARAVLSSVEEAEEEMALRRQKPAGRLRVDAASPFVLHVLVPLVPGFRALYPDIELELYSSDHFIDLIEQRTDVAFRIGPLQDSTLHARPMGSTRRRVVATPGYLERHGRPRRVEELQAHQLVGFTQPDSLNRWPLRHAGGTRLPVTPDVRASSGESVRQLLLADQGLGCLSDFMTHRDRAEGRLVQVLTQSTVEFAQPIHAVYYRNTQLASRVTCYLDYMARAFAEEDWGIVMR
jgi:DNA-binding transcriptional LysR family regulator